MTDPAAPTLRDLLRPHLSAAVSAGRPAAHVARDAGMMPEALSRLMRPGYNGKASGYEAIARALGLRVDVVAIARAEQRHPSAVLDDIEGPVRGVAIRVGCSRGDDRSRSACMFRATHARLSAQIKRENDPAAPVMSYDEQYREWMRQNDPNRQGEP